MSFGPPVNCDPCDPEVYEPEDILTVDISSFFEPIGVAVEAYITAQTGGLVQPEVDIEASGGARTCCLDDGSVGMEVYGHAGASLEVSVGPGISKEASATISMGDNVEASISGEFQVGLQATGSISLEGEVSSGCNFSGLEVTASGEVALRFFGGVAGEATATYTAGPLEGEAEVAAINGSINGGAHISFEYKDGAMTTEACFEGIYYSAYVKLAGTTYSLFNDAEGNPIEKVYLLPSTCEPDEVGLMSALRAEVIPGVEEAIRAAIAKQLGPEAAKQLHAKSGGAPIKFSGRSRVTLKSASAIVNGNPGGRGGVQLMDGEGVCAKVKLRLEQEAVLTRNAFNATLEIVNGDTAALESVEVLVNITDENYQDMSDVFAIRPPTTPVDGTGQAAAMSTWSASWILIPTREAAPESPKMYLVGGTLKYVQDGRQVIVPLQPVPITVYPDPLLYIKYFHQRDVFADDPFTPAIEPSIPYSLAVLAENRGKGLAKNLRITSAQPQIVENEKGLLIDFKIIASQVEEENLTPSLTVSLGNIEPGATKIGRWLLTSTLQGLFIDYQVTFEHLDAIAGKKTALIDDVSIHEMIHMVSAPAPFDDGRPDFLVNDLPDPPTDYPDRLYLSNGHTNEVLVVTAAVPDGAPSAGDPTVQLTATLPPGFVYLRVPEPSNGQMKLYAVKEGSRDILMDVAQVTGIANAWVTDRTFVGEGNKPVRESILHLFDYHPNAEGPVTYTLIYEELPPLDTSAPSSLVKTLPTASAKSFALSWEGADSDGSPVAAYDLYVSDNGGAFTPWLTGTRFTGAQYTGELGHTYAFYSRAKDAAGNVEPAPAEPDAATTVAYETTGPRLSEIGGQDLLEDAVAHAVAFTVSDPDTPLDTLRFTVESSNLALLPAAGLVLGGTGADRTLAITPAAGRSGPGEVTLRVSDGSESASRTFLVKVAAVNDPPVAGEDQIVRPLDRGVKVAVSELLANDSDPEFDALTLTSVSSASKNGAVVSRVGGWVFYEPSDTSGNADDEFTYVVSDGNGGSAQGRVVVRTSGEGGAVAVELSVSVNPDGTITLEYVGIPGRWYAIQRAASLSNPSWLTLETVQADGSGLIRYTDMAPPVGGAFYRAVDLTPAQP